MNYPKVSIIILNWNGWKDTIECLESLYQITYPNYDVIVVDNGSKDNSVQKIKDYCEGKIKVESKFFNYNPNNKPIYILEYTKEEAERGGNRRREKYFSKLPSNRKLRLILNDKNYGFAEGNNIGIRYALKALNPDYILLLNNDTVVDPNFLTELVRVAESDEKIGIVGPKIYFYDYNGKINVIWFYGGIINYWRLSTTHIGFCREDNKATAIPERLDYITGCVFLIKKDILNNVGLLDSDYFAYYEEIDYCLRTKNKGYKLAVSPNAKVWHKISKSAGKYQLYYMTRNRALLMMKNFSTSKVKFGMGFIFYVADFIKKTLIRILKRDFDTARLIIKGFYDGLKFIIDSH